MKERFTDECGHEWHFNRWRIKPPGYKLPCNNVSIPPEGIWINELGWEMGLDPNSPWTCDGEYQRPIAPIQETVIYEKKLNSKARRKLERDQRFGRI